MLTASLFITGLATLLFAANPAAIYMPTFALLIGIACIGIYIMQEAHGSQISSEIEHVSKS